MRRSITIRLPDAIREELEAERGEYETLTSVILKRLQWSSRWAKLMRHAKPSEQQTITKILNRKTKQP